MSIGIFSLHNITYFILFLVIRELTGFHLCDLRTLLLWGYTISNNAYNHQVKIIPLLYSVCQYFKSYLILKLSTTLMGNNNNNGQGNRGANE